MQNTFSRIIDTPAGFDHPAGGLFDEPFTRRRTRKRLPQYGSISESNVIPRLRPFVSSVARISSLLLTMTHSPGCNPRLSEGVRFNNPKTLGNGRPVSARWILL